jgi:hypothetical protein
MRGFSCIARAVSLCLLSGVGIAQQSPSALNVVLRESEIKAELRNGITEVLIPVEVNTGHSMQADISLEWLDPRSKVLRSIRRPIVLEPGNSIIATPLSVKDGDIFLRLRYALTPSASDPKAFLPRQGIVALSSIATHAFEIKVGHIESLKQQRNYLVHVHAIQAGTRAPVERIEWTALLNIDDQKTTPIRVISLEGGFTEIEFALPENLDPESVEGSKIEITGKIGDFEAAVTADLHFQARTTARIQTDKPIYQPEQVIHFRAVLVRGDGKVVAGEKVSLDIEDTRSETMHTAELTSSRFGIVADDWTLPANAELGNYRLRLRGLDGDVVLGTHVVKVSRYELPTFRVTTDLDRAVYLPLEQPTVTVRAEYLFGKPVLAGTVKITRLLEPVWNPRRRKDVPSEETLGEGATTDGSFSIKLDLTENHKDLFESEQKFKDLNFAAYYTDSSTGRTEQRKFDVRITREPIHVYIERPQMSGELDAPVYISTYYADGKPARTSVEFSADGKTFRANTNLYGIAKLLLVGDLAEDATEFHARAVDPAGLAGTVTQRNYGYTDQSMRLETPRTMYRSGEAVHVRLLASGDEANRSVMVYAATEDSGIVARKVVQLVNGSADIEFPYQDAYLGPVVFVAWDGRGKNVGLLASALAVRTVLFPKRSDLRVVVNPERNSYRPGEMAAIKVSVSRTSGAPVESALGVAIVDESVLERERTDAEFGQRSWFRCSFCNDIDNSEVGGVSFATLLEWDWSKPMPDGLDLVAEVFASRSVVPLFVDGEDNLLADLSGVFLDTFKAQISGLQTFLDQRYLAGAPTPRSIEDLYALGPTWSSLRDPWGEPYTARFIFDRDNEVIDIWSSGPDKARNTDDDFSVGTVKRSYFLPVRRLLEPVLRDVQEYPNSAGQFLTLFRDHGIDLEKISDPWGTSYRPQVQTYQATRQFQIVSAGPDRVFDSGDDVYVASFSGRYFQRETASIRKALTEAASPPGTPEEFRVLIELAGVHLDALRDPWGNAYRATRTVLSRLAERRNDRTVRVFSGTSIVQTTITPVTENIARFAIISAGPDGIAATLDDFSVAEFLSLIDRETPASTPKTTLIADGRGTVLGTLLDPSGAVIPNATVELIADDGSGVLNSTTDSSGRFLFTDVPAGKYSVEANVPGFLLSTILDVPVSDALTTDIDVVMRVGAVSETITVSEGAVALATESSSLSSIVQSTPRVREYFPETMLWVPELITDAQGKARAAFRMADTVTNWKVAVIASTVDGKIAEGSADIRAFQPFFLDYQPPSLLTAGDRLSVPVTVRNYETRSAKATVTHGREARAVTVAANDSTNVHFDLRADVVAEVKHRVTVRAGRSSDAIERTIRVHPDGQQVTRTIGDLVTGATAFDIKIPSAAISDATRQELRFYPGTLAILAQSAQALLVKPHGCAEQTISAGWANLIALQYAEAIGASSDSFRAKAIKNLSETQNRLRTYQDGSGAVSYWEGEEPDIAVTAYALQFLIEASDELAIDPNDLKEMIRWLERHQDPNGTWIAGRDSSEAESILLTALVARSLAAAHHEGIAVGDKVLALALGRVGEVARRFSEPYMLAQFLLATMDSGSTSQADEAVSQLVRMAHEERGMIYWDLPTNTPFYGWGAAGRIETTGTVLNALSQWRAAHADRSDLDAAIRRGLLFLLRERDSYGSWYSTQATLQAMKAITTAEDVLGHLDQRGGNIEIRVNGRLIKVVSLPIDPNATDPFRVDVSSALSPGENRVELVPARGTAPFSVQAVTTYWTPWEQTKARENTEVRLSIDFDKRNAKVGEAIRCKVTAERVGFRGYGMLMAEIGLPPGMDVDRSSLESALDVLGIDRYELLPDRVLFYLWPPAGGVDFDFIMRPRMALAAKSAASVLYDYYNPEAMAEAAPVRFDIQ